MVNTELLEEEIKQAGVKKSHLAKICGISRGTLANKINNVSEFTAAEIVTLSSALGFNNGKRDKIFLRS